VPSSIRAGTIGFIESRTEGSDKEILRMTFSHGTAATFGSIDIDDPVFLGVQFFELEAKVVNNEFNKLFIGNLAFLAMLIGMNHSAGDHCLMCALKGSEFNCIATVGRTKWQTCGEATSLHDLKIMKEDVWRTVLRSGLISLSIDNRLY
jgi:hypothetical protein